MRIIFYFFIILFSFYNNATVIAKNVPTEVVIENRESPNNNDNNKSNKLPPALENEINNNIKNIDNNSNNVVDDATKNITTNNENKITTESTNIESKKENKENKEKTVNREDGDKNTKEEIKKKVESKQITPFQEEFYTVFDSFMFSNNMIKTVQKALVLYNDKGFNRVKQNEDDTEEDDTEEDENEENENEEELNNTMGNIYLKAIAFISDNFWTVWINDKKISNLNNLDDDNEYVIEDVNTNEAKIIFTVSRQKWNYINTTGAIDVEDYSFNDEKNKIEFKLTLHPNQTFVSSKNIIVDGKYKGEAEKLIESVGSEELDSFLNENFGDEEQNQETTNKTTSNGNNSNTRQNNNTKTNNRQKR